MMLRDIKSIHDVILAYHNKYKLMNKAGKYFKIINIEEAKTRSTPGYYITLQWRDKQPEYRLDKIIENFKIVLIDNKENKMEDFVKRMIIEHKELCERIDKLDAFVHNVDTPKNVHPVEYANLCIQLRGMKMYEDALRARLHNQGVEVDGDNYYATIKVEDEEESAINND